MAPKIKLTGLRSPFHMTPTEHVEARASIESLRDPLVDSMGGAVPSEQTSKPVRRNTPWYPSPDDDTILRQKMQGPIGDAYRDPVNGETLESDDAWGRRDEAFDSNMDRAANDQRMLSRQIRDRYGISAVAARGLREVGVGARDSQLWDNYILTGNDPLKSIAGPLAVGTAGAALLASKNASASEEDLYPREKVEQVRNMEPEYRLRFLKALTPEKRARLVRSREYYDQQPTQAVGEGDLQPALTGGVAGAVPPSRSVVEIAPDAFRASIGRNETQKSPSAKLLDEGFVAPNAVANVVSQVVGQLVKQGTNVLERGNYYSPQNMMFRGMADQPIVDPATVVSDILSGTNAVAWGSAPHVAAAFEAATPAIISQFTYGPVSDQAKAEAKRIYAAKLPVWQAIYEEAEKRAPGASLVGGLAAPWPFQKLGFLGRVGANLTAGAAQAVIRAPANEPLSASDVIGSAIINSAFGEVVHGATHLFGRAPPMPLTGEDVATLSEYAVSERPTNSVHHSVIKSAEAGVVTMGENDPIPVLNILEGGNVARVPLDNVKSAIKAREILNKKNKNASIIITKPAQALMDQDVFETLMLNRKTTPTKLNPGMMLITSPDGKPMIVPIDSVHAKAASAAYRDMVIVKTKDGFKVGVPAIREENTLLVNPDEDTGLPSDRMLVPVTDVVVPTHEEWQKAFESGDLDKAFKNGTQTGEIFAKISTKSGPGSGFMPIQLHDEPTFVTPTSNTPEQRGRRPVSQEPPAPPPGEPASPSDIPPEGAQKAYEFYTLYKNYDLVGKKLPAALTPGGVRLADNLTGLASMRQASRALNAQRFAIAEKIRSSIPKGTESTFNYWLKQYAMGNATEEQIRKVYPQVWPHVEESVKTYTTKIQENHQWFVDNGYLPPEDPDAADLGRYLARMYLANTMPQGEWAKMAQRAPKKMASWAKSIEKDFGVTSAEASEILSNIMNAGEKTDEVYHKLVDSKAVPTSRLRKRQDLPYYIREAKGEIRDGAFLIGHSLAAQNALKQNILMWNELGKNPEWVRPKEAITADMKPGTHWVPIPDNRNLYGDAAGMYAHEDLWREFGTHLKDLNKAHTMVEVLNGYFKANTVPYSGFPSWFRSWAQNWHYAAAAGGLDIGNIQNPYAGSYLWALGHAYRQIAKDSRNPLSSQLINDAKRYGIDGPGFAGVEIINQNKNLHNEALRTIESYGGEVDSKGLGDTVGMMTKIHHKAGGLYDILTDRAHKLATFDMIVQRLEKQNVDPHQARLQAAAQINRYFPMPDRVAPALDAVRGKIGVVNPFLTYAAEDLRLAASLPKNIAKDPAAAWRLLKFYSIAGAAFSTAALQSYDWVGASPEDVEAAKKLYRATSKKRVSPLLMAFANPLAKKAEDRYIMVDPADYMPFGRQIKMDPTIGPVANVLINIGTMSAEGSFSDDAVRWALQSVGVGRGPDFQTKETNPWDQGGAAFVQYMWQHGLLGPTAPNNWYNSARNTGAVGPQSYTKLNQSVLSQILKNTVGGVQDEVSIAPGSPNIKAAAKSTLGSVNKTIGAGISAMGSAGQPGAMVPQAQRTIQGETKEQRRKKVRDSMKEQIRGTVGSLRDVRNSLDRRGK